MMATVAVDCMGGDHGVSVTLPALGNFLRRDPAVKVIAVGRDEDLGDGCKRLASEFGSRIELRAASEVVAMDEPVANALRGKKDSSMRVAIDLVHGGLADACVSAGNTGALMAIGRFVLKTIAGVDRPAICTVLPSRLGRTYVLDLGANVDCSAEHLQQFAIMGSVLASALERSANPRVGLLNVGEEQIKGHEVVKRAAELLRSSPLNFVGNVEGNDIFSGAVDVAVCDGFVGNIALKASEGLAQYISSAIKSEFSSGPLARLSALVALPVLNRLRNRLDHRRHNGACLIGLRGIVVKSHGSADAFSFGFALDRAAEAARQKLPEMIARRMAELPLAGALCD